MVICKLSGKLEVAALSIEGKGRKLLIVLAFYSQSRHTRFSQSPTLNSIVDGERIAFGPAATKNWDIGNDGVEESASFIVTREQLSKLAAASSVEMQINIAEFRLKKEFTQALGDLLKALPSGTSQ